MKGNGVLAAAGDAILVAARIKVDQRGAFQAFATPSRRTAAFFAWQNDYDYGQCILTIPCPSGRIGRMIGQSKGNADIQGTAPDDDPV
ncbi:hypothetical protein LMTR13_33865 [Bradyrhizobium icense]|uniref:Uncharacterized protein n=1 Tax=Bradyrhizobium icense TaxID=1274631 RepID=A0A1B1UNV7_9BRAD|nr:hypothetical protein LMTR13_33865 [Bradyrhizobium icense]